MHKSVIPKPAFSEINENAPGFTLYNGCTLRDETGTEGIFDDFCFFLGEKFGYVPIGGSADGIYLSFSDKPLKAEGYEINCSDGVIRITASDAAGLFYALQTLKQLFSDGGTVPCLTVKDEPRFSQRGLMLDVSRHFFTVECVRLFIDAMALHKLNRLHLHLTDDQGWRFESERFPLLTLIGSERPFTALDRVPHRGFYSREDINEIVSYARSRYIRVIPEIDIPGHCTAAIAAMPGLSCTGEAADVSTSFGVKNRFLCMGKDETYAFARGLIDELLQLFPDGEIHLGFNDIPLDKVNDCPLCRRKTEENGLQGSEQLVRYFFEKITENREGTRFTVWKDGRQENASGFIDSPTEYALGTEYGANSLEKCYRYVPDENALGVEGLLFSEYVSTFEKAGYLLFPRLAAISESGWTAPEKKDYPGFTKALDNYFSLLRLYGLPYADKKQADPSFIVGAGKGIYTAIVKRLSENGK